MENDFEIYGGFAGVYDEFMDNVSYDEWYDFLHYLLGEYGKEKGSVVELACGTGEITKRLSGSGYQVTGIDLSEDMLALAREKCQDEVLLLHQDMCELELCGEADAFVCAGDGMNYLLEREQLFRVFQNVSRYLKKDGIFLFDLKTDYYFREVVGNRTITDNREDASYIWENSYDEAKMRNEYLLTVYKLVDDERDLFERTDELHYQQVFPVEVVKEELERAGLVLKQAYEAFTGERPKEDSERLYIAAAKR